MGRPKLNETKQQIAARIPAKTKAVIETMTTEEKRTESQMIAILLDESPRVKARLNGKRRNNGSK